MLPSLPGLPLLQPPDDLYTSLPNGHCRGERYIFWSFQTRRVIEINTLVTIKPGVTERQGKSLGLEFINHYLAEIQESQTGNLWAKCSLKVYIVTQNFFKKKALDDNTKILGNFTYESSILASFASNCLDLSTIFQVFFPWSSSLPIVLK